MGECIGGSSTCIVVANTTNTLWRERESSELQPGPETYSQIWGTQYTRALTEATSRWKRVECSYGVHSTGVSEVIKWPV